MEAREFLTEFWSFVSVTENQVTLAWIGAALTAVATGIWAIVKHFFPQPTKEDGANEEPPEDAAANEGVSRFRLVIVGEQGDVQRHDLLYSRTLIVGRGRKADIQLPSYDKAASRRNATIIVHSDHLEVVNIKESVNGTKLNGAIIERGEATPGDVITCGKTSLRVELQPDGTGAL